MRRVGRLRLRLKRLRSLPLEGGGASRARAEAGLGEGVMGGVTVEKVRVIVGEVLEARRAYMRDKGVRGMLMEMKDMYICMQRRHRRLV